MAPSQDAGSVGAADKQLSYRLRAGKNIQREAEKPLRAGTQLLFLPRRGGSLPHRGDAGGYRKLELQIRLLCGRVFSLYRSANRAVCLRLAVSFWADSGSAAQDTLPEKAKNLPE